MDVLVERFQRRRIVSDKSSPMLYYLRQKPKTCGTVDIDVLAASIQKNCAMTKGDVKHVIEALVEEIQANLAKRCELMSGKKIIIKNETEKFTVKVPLLYE